MGFGPRLDLRQRQSLVMTPQLQQAIKLLQMSNLELIDFVSEELDRNPVLERGEAEPGSDGPRDEDWRSDHFNQQLDSATIQTPESIDADTLARSDHTPNQADAPLDTDYENIYSDSRSDSVPVVDTGLAATDWSGSRGSGGNFDDPDVRLDQSLSSDLSLRDYLMEQLPLIISDSADRLIGQQLIDSVNEYGYLMLSVDDVCDQLSVHIDDVERVLACLQTIEPTGLLARDLKECITMQLKEKNRFDPMIEAFLDHLPAVAERRLNDVARILGCDHEDVNDMLAEIRDLNPKPGLAFGKDDSQILIPDVFVRLGPNAEWMVDLNTETLPRVLVNNQYRATVKQLSETEKTFLTEAIQSANWLVRALDQRANTILKVSTELVQQQKAFFNRGIRYLKPLTLRDIAEAIEMHESTVSRVTSNKYMETPRGTFQLKYFFTTGLPGAGGASHSSESVRYRIKQLIDSEDPKKILSDDKLVELLKLEGIEVARRTVAKYRENMDIGSSVQRRKQKQLLG